MTKRRSKRKGRFSARKKAEAVRRLVAGEDLDVLARCSHRLESDPPTAWKVTHPSSC